MTGTESVAYRAMVWETKQSTRDAVVYCIDIRSNRSVTQTRDTLQGIVGSCRGYMGVWPDDHGVRTWGFVMVALALWGHQHQSRLRVFYGNDECP